MVPMTLGSRGTGRRRGVERRTATPTGWTTGSTGDSLGLGVLREGSRADSLSDPPHPARTSVDETIRVASRNIRRA